jgi:serine protease Do
LAAFGLALSVSVTLAACGGGDDDDDATDRSRTTEEDDGAASGAITDITDAQSAIVRIVAKGTFAEPSEQGITSYQEVTGVGSGSGFIISREGLVVTNNHVVTGAASLEVYIGDEENDPVSAKVLGVSECNDLAVIDIDGDGYPFLTWSSNAKTGTDVRAAGFPLGDPEFTLTSGIVSKAEANGDTPWASIGHTIEHDAAIQPGNSGGPLLDAEDGSVIGVDYATNDPGTGTNQFFAISSELAKDVVDELSAGTDVLSLGVNGQAIFSEEDGVVGVWVSSVASGSPADETGIQAGDIIERIEGLPLATDGTMKDYCDILRSHDPGDELSVQVLRFEDLARYEGEFNGDPLEPVESLVDDVDQQTGGSLGAGESYEYTTVQDDTGVLIVDVPTAWSDVQTSTVALDGGEELPQIIAAPSVDGYLDTYDTPGMSFAISADGSTAIEDWLASSQFSPDCTSSGPEDYDDGLYAGSIEYWTNCGTSGAAIVVIAAAPSDGSFTVRVVAQLLTDADAEALDRIIQTFRVVTE